MLLVGLLFVAAIYPVALALSVQVHPMMPATL
jgi:hypothetical protein